MISVIHGFNQEWLWSIILLIFLLTKNPLKVPGIKTEEIFKLTTGHCGIYAQNVSAIIYFAIATQTGPYFETGNKDHLRKGKHSHQSEDYNMHEEELAKQLFLALGADMDFIKMMVFALAPEGKQNTLQARDFLDARETGWCFVSVRGREMDCKKGLKCALKDSNKGGKN